MTDFVKIQRNDVFTDSMVIAKGTDNKHESVVRLTMNYREDFEDYGKLEFTDLKSGKRGRPTRVYLLNEQQATLLVTYFDNTETVRKFKKELVRQFYEMRRLLMERQTIEWRQMRAEGKAVRMQETDAIKALIGYAKAQGSQNADKLYVVYSKLVKALAGHGGRDAADAETLTEILVFERLLFGIITAEMAQDTPYREIYRRANIS